MSVQWPNPHRSDTEVVYGTFVTLQVRHGSCANCGLGLHCDAKNSAGGLAPNPNIWI